MWTKRNWFKAVVTRAAVDVAQTSRRWLPSMIVNGLSYDASKDWSVLI